MRKQTSYFRPLRALIFDMDGTLYQSTQLALRYDQSLYAFVAAKKNLSLTAAQVLFDNTYTRLFQRLKRQPSKLYTLTRMGLSDLEWASAQGFRVRPEKILKPDLRLRKTLLELRKCFLLAVVTNNHQVNLGPTLRALQVDDCFDQILTLSDHRWFKPSSRLYALMAKRLNVDPQQCMSVGDRYDLDLAPAAEVGMQTLLVQSMEDIYRLPQVCEPILASLYTLENKMQIGTAIASAGQALKNGRLVVLPTDTVYGLAACMETSAIEAVYRAKGRDDKKPLLVLLAEQRHAARFAEISTRAEEMMKKYWPGALTLVLPVKKGTAWDKMVHSRRTIGLRVPAHPIARKIIQQAGGALAVTSANRSESQAPTSVTDIEREILAFADVVLDDGVCTEGMHSTIVKVAGNKTGLIRQGSVHLDLLHG